MKIFLIGFMGSGKSHWGKMWAEENEMSFYDIDKVIESTEKKSILEIFEINGETYFRKQESIALRSMLEHDDCIIACGGGTACFDNNIEWMNENGLTIYLHSSPAELLETIVRDRDKRPLLAKIDESELLFFIEKKLAERKQYYERAKLRLRARLLNQQIFKKIISPTD